jgi:hypothetical protein
MTSRCYTCHQALVKQVLNEDGSVLTATQRAAYDTAMAYRSRNLICENCEYFCFHTDETTPPPANHEGVCEQCGGKASRKHPEPPPFYLAMIQLFPMWSCPVHGSIPSH